jgi:hypothetical protein
MLMAVPVPRFERVEPKGRRDQQDERQYDQLQLACRSTAVART